MLKEIFLHVIDRGDLHCFLVEALDVCPQRFISALDDCFEQSLLLWVSTRGGEVSRKYPPKLLPGGDRLVRETLIPRHCSLLESGWEQSALDGPSDSSIVEESVNVLNMFAGVLRSIVGSDRRWLLQADRELGFCNFS